MVGMWLTTLGLVFFLMITVVFLLYTLKGPLDSRDSYYVDPLPKDQDPPNQK
ncbi:hypothetical protein IMZ08_21395 [Bacillus luteolus]|uniref:Uncharacterized protein n=1 Tax=Litchfieldia luteola TaxID=682179 RepID=A0ABR9QQ28_9BACI|nr:hypothetical protein [Cytobacillus luteolus]MBE4910598.1 hypothetical protein [Cytobacillus luteolus]MBP1943776.1 hypothetical protein [Cytobacillus luteolus]